MKRLAAVRSMDEMYDYMLAQGKTAAATKPQKRPNRNRVERQRRRVVRRQRSCNPL